MQINLLNIFIACLHNNCRISDAFFTGVFLTSATFGNIIFNTVLLYKYLSPSGIFLIGSLRLSQFVILISLCSCMYMTETRKYYANFFDFSFLDFSQNQHCKNVNYNKKTAKKKHEIICSN